MSELDVGRGRIALVDDDNLARVQAAGPWRIGSKGYVITDAVWPARYTVRLHRLVMGLEPGDGLQVDHINRDPSDNRRVNLRVVTAQENNLNKGEYSNSQRGVTVARNGRFRARARRQSVLHSLGTFDTRAAAEAAVAAFRG